MGELIQLGSNENKLYKLDQNYPNPFSDETQFSFYIPQRTQVEFTIFNMLGEVVEELVSQEMKTGNYNLKYKTKNLQTGSYFYRLKTPEFNDTKKMAILK